MKHQSQEMESPTNQFLFGEDFESKIVKDSKIEKKTDLVFTGLQTASSSNKDATKRQPFQKSLLPWTKGRGRGSPSGTSTAGNQQHQQGSRGKQSTSLFTIKFFKEFKFSYHNIFLNQMKSALVVKEKI